MDTVKLTCVNYKYLTNETRIKDKNYTDKTYRQFAH
jgi:hypothetical protein